MTISMYQASIPVFRRGINAMTAVLDKAEAQAAAKKFDAAVLLSSRLYPDMFPLTRQIQIMTDGAKGCAARLAGIEIPKFEDTESSFADLKARLAKTLDFVSSVTPAQIDGTEDKDIVLTLGGNPTTFKGQQYLLGFVLPNFYFHGTTAYAILRHNGIEIGKRDFLGQI
ncbi:DUF1993 family protein [uncultured Alsobacter sp.]|uniref:DUF1993 domain-containing protein n=1 Tax=uncultured Alsobacter sp. TaxID=1748258 RepID=UPI0025D4463D|nr:DUF1993 family protein [uncultured Alsobacter sp.]